MSDQWTATEQHPAHRDRFVGDVSLGVLGVATLAWAATWFINGNASPGIAGWFLSPLACVVLWSACVWRAHRAGTSTPVRCRWVLAGAVVSLLPSVAGIFGPLFVVALVVLALAIPERSTTMGVIAAVVLVANLITATELGRILGVGTIDSASGFVATGIGIAGVLIAVWGLNGVALHVRPCSDQASAGHPGGDVAAGDSQ
ncbi:hypothetical protein [Rhodococcus artemisiae]|uniref:Uncharacterized protein n=1 Tax=Rhodococcus artemisiae TaxID=714159 RepID=A0ABU7L347_9NOCA|nr:hypothetical protein [Rhodococcus artemisiae]MEE2055955.1 hypothetical protein [Rhodococcus artemisiae]